MGILHDIIKKFSDALQGGIQDGIQDRILKNGNESVPKNTSENSMRKKWNVKESRSGMPVLHLQVPG